MFDEALRRGFRPVLCLRRGHLGPERPITTPKIGIVGHADDARRQVQRAMERHPVARHVVGLGCSAGTGVLVRLTGEDAASSPFTAIAMNCPGTFCRELASRPDTAQHCTSRHQAHTAIARTMCTPGYSTDRGGAFDRLWPAFDQYILKSECASDSCERANSRPPPSHSTTN